MIELNMLNVPLLFMYVAISDTAGEPCSTANALSVVNICTDETKIQDATNSVIIKADLRQNCTCELSVLNQDKTVTINIQKYNQSKSSSPSTYGCGLILKFGTEKNHNWEAQCIVQDNIVSLTLKTNDVMTIKSFTVNGTLIQNEGYCIEIKQGVQDSAGNRLMLTCGIGSIDSYITTAAIAKTTRSSTDKTHPLMTTKTTEQQLTTSFYSDDFISATASDNTYLPLTTKQTYHQKKGIDKTALYVSISATVVGVSTVIIVAIMVLNHRRFRKLTQCKNMTRLGSNAIYDQLSLPANSADNASISSNYSSLNVIDCQSSYDNKRLEGSQNIPLSTISRVQRNNIQISEDERNNDNRNKRRNEYYTNLVF